MIDYDDYEYDTSKKTIKKIKMDTKTECYFVPNKKDENGNIIPSSMGIIPTVLQTLLSARKDTKKRLKNEKDRAAVILYMNKNTDSPLSLQ